ncbi:hypothetical protein EKG83_30655 [Saccharothrix syringae]|uniref:Uncharacterized protein n=1 Tax=Saccharothrix syringae TaxID=103733 RepID=A0A5Q0H4L4_SACSY|nr:hypothetical protein EKG83_30655 [Saccharothrix syringae]
MELRTALEAHPLVARVAVVRQADRTVAVVVPRSAPAALPARPPRIAQLLDRAGRLAPRRVLQIGIGDVELPASLSAQCTAYRLVDPSLPRVCDVLTRRPDLRRRMTVRAISSLGDLLAAPDRYDLVLVDLAAPSLSTVDVRSAVVGWLRLAGDPGAVLVANLRDPRVERLASRAGTTPGAAGWSPPALLRNLAVGPGVEAHAYPALDLTGDFDVVLRRAGAGHRTPMLRWNREVQSPEHLARLLAVHCVERVRLVGIPLAGVVDTALARRADVPHPGAVRYGYGHGVDWREVEAIGADHGYEVTFAAPLTGAEYHFDAVLERSGVPARPTPPTPDRLAPRLRRWLALRAPDIADQVDLVVLGADELAAIARTP